MIITLSCCYVQFLKKNKKSYSLGASYICTASPNKTYYIIDVNWKNFNISCNLEQTCSSWLYELIQSREDSVAINSKMAER